MIIVLMIIITVILIAWNTNEDKKNTKDWVESTNRFKYGDEVIVLDSFYKDEKGIVVGQAFSDGYDCTVFDGFKVKLEKEGKIIITDKLKEVK